ncbi:MAG TPA: endonuclease domain-containing protein [Acidimicrobiia bacterium]|nr:endonuclease domain-containing protein [Acidimicrobiia bacterium]
MGRPAHTSIAAKRANQLRSRMTISEARLWRAIQGRAVGARFRRQVPIGYWIADFASLDPRLVIEVDDTSHEFRDETMRSDYFHSRGFSVLRFTNKRVAKELPEVVGTIEAWVEHIRLHCEAPE